MLCWEIRWETEPDFPADAFFLYGETAVTPGMVRHTMLTRHCKKNIKM